MAISKEERKKRLLERMRQGMKKGGGDFESTSIFKPDLDVSFWNPKEGQHFFDIVPYITGPNDIDLPEGEEAYCFQPYMHRNIGPNNRNVICLAKSYGRPCALCDYHKELVREGADEDLIDEIKAQANPRAIYNVHVLDSKEEQKKGIQIFHTSHYIMEGTLLELAATPTTPDSKEISPFTPYPSRYEDGKTVSFKRKGTGVNTRFIAHSLQDRDYPISEKLIKAAHCLDQLIYIPTYEEQKAWLTGEEVEETEEVEFTDNKVTKDKTPPAKTGKPEEVPLKEELEGMNRAKLKKYIRDNDLKVSVKPKMGDSEIVEAIVNEIEGGDSQTSEPPSDTDCPHGFVFGQDLDEHDECPDCPQDTWNACAKKAEELME